MRREKNFVFVTQISTAIIQYFLLWRYSFKVTFLFYASQHPWGVALHEHHTCYDVFQETALKRCQ